LVLINKNIYVARGSGKENNWCADILLTIPNEISTRQPMSEVVHMEMVLIQMLDQVGWLTWWEKHLNANRNWAGDMGHQKSSPPKKNYVLL